MINSGDVTKQNIKYHKRKYKRNYSPNWPQIPDHLYRILIIRESGSGKTNSLFNLISYQPDIDKIYLYSKDPYEAKYQFLVKKQESIELKHLNDSKAFIEYSNDMNDIYKNIEEYNSRKKCKILFVFDDMTADILSNKKRNPIVTELFFRCKKLNIILVFITQSCFVVPKNITINSTHYFIMKIPNKRELQQIAFNYSSDIDFIDFINFYKKCFAKPYSPLVIDALLASDNPSRFRKNILERI